MKHLDPSFETKNTVRFSVVDGEPEKRQALIPNPIIENYIFEMQCAKADAEDNSKIGAHGPVDWGLESMKGYGLGKDSR